MKTIIVKDFTGKDIRLSKKQFCRKWVKAHAEPLWNLDSNDTTSSHLIRSITHSIQVLADHHFDELVKRQSEDIDELIQIIDLDDD